MDRLSPDLQPDVRAHANSVDVSGNEEGPSDRVRVWPSFQSGLEQRGGNLQMLPLMRDPLFLERELTNEFSSSCAIPHVDRERLIFRTRVTIFVSEPGSYTRACPLSS